MYNFIQQAYNQPDLSDAMKSLAKLIYRLEFIQNRIAKSEELKRNPEIRRIDLTCNQILDKHLPELMDEYCKLSVKYRNEVSVKEKKTREGIKQLTSKDILLADLGHLLEESDILEKNLNDNSNHDFLAKSSFITESFGVQPKIHLEGDEPEKKINIENEFDAGGYQDMEMQEFFSEFFKKYPEQKIQNKPVIKSRALEEDKNPAPTSVLISSPAKATSSPTQTQPEEVVSEENNSSSVSTENNDGDIIVGGTLLMMSIILGVVFIFSVSNTDKKIDNSFQKITPIPHHVVKAVPAPHIITPLSASEQASAIANNMDKNMIELQQKYKGDYSEMTSHAVASPVSYINGIPSASYIEKNPGYAVNDMTISQMRVEPTGPQTISVSIVNIPQNVCMQTTKNLQDMASSSYIISPSCGGKDYDSVKIISNENQGIKIGIGHHIPAINKIKIGVE